MPKKACVKDPKATEEASLTQQFDSSFIIIILSNE
jgi:hypothetical protein